MRRWSAAPTKRALWIPGDTAQYGTANVRTAADEWAEEAAGGSIHGLALSVWNLVVSAWPTLPADVQQRIVALARGATNG